MNTYPRTIEFLTDMSELPEPNTEEWRRHLFGARWVCSETVFGDFGVWHITFENADGLVLAKVYDHETYNMETAFRMVLHPDKVYFVGDRDRIPFQTIDVEGKLHVMDNVDYVEWDLTFYTGYRDGFQIRLPLVRKPKPWDTLFRGG